MTKKQKKMLKRIVTASVLFIFLNIINKVFAGGELKSQLWYKVILISFYAGAYFVIGYDILKKAFKGIIKGQVFDENFLMAVATLGAIGVTIYNTTAKGSTDYDFNEAVAVMLFYQIGEFFQSVAVGKSRKSITALMDIRPDYANVEKDGKLFQVDPEEVAVGSVIIVQPGERVPLDGFILEGTSTLNTSALTGESLPREVSVDDEVISGCINMTGVLKVQTTKAYGDSTVSKILTLVEESSSRKSKSENFISKFARVYTPIVCVGALVLAIIPPVINLVSGNEALLAEWIYRALTFLVISCPCALVVSIPLSFFAGLGAASKEGVLIKGSNYLETLSKVRTVVFDKTGTLTKGVFEVAGVHHNKIEEEKLLGYAALAECSSNHPIAVSLRDAYGKEIDRNLVTDIQEIAGHGLTALVCGNKVACGNGKLMESLNLEYKPCSHTGTVIHVAVNGEYAGHILVSDVIKPEAKDAIKNLKKAGVRKTVMLTGDARAVAEKVGQALGLTEVHAELLPQDKVSQVERLLEVQSSEKDSGKLAFVGDGINDAPVLSRADIGIAMGAMGSDAAIEAADIVLMDDNPVKISRGIKISRKCIRIVYENIVFAIGVKFLCLVLGAFGIANMWTAIFADVGVMVLAVLNAIRALRCK
ncbi:MAG: cadmium-translocating P-type ATPase [Treponema sp.]|nr:cadmium-translocating P-type ATPase [Treponema sp.]